MKRKRLREKICQSDFELEEKEEEGEIDRDDQWHQRKHRSSSSSSCWSHILSPPPFCVFFWNFHQRKGRKRKKRSFSHTWKHQRMSFSSSFLLLRNYLFSPEMAFLVAFLTNAKFMWFVPGRKRRRRRRRRKTERKKRRRHRHRRCRRRGRRPR